MTGEQLREELQRIADRAPSIAVDGDLFDRGRRATRRARVVTAAAVVGCLAVLAAVAVPLLRPDPPPVAGADVLGVPDHLYAVPDHVADEPEDVRKVGRAAAAFLTGSGVPVVVGAEDGAYHPVVLHGLLSGAAGSVRYLSEPPVALSPDGTRLAWGMLAGFSGDNPTSSIWIADLTTGRIQDVPVKAQGRNVLVGQVRWSANGQWLAWGGSRIDQWRGDGTSSTSGQYGGVVSTDGDTSEAHELPEAEVVTDDDVSSGNLTPDVFVSDDGELAAVGGNGLWRDGRNTRFDLAGNTAIYGAWFDGDQVVGLRRAVDGTDGRAYLVELPGPDNVMVRTDLDRPDRIGQLDPQTQVLATEALDEDGSPEPRVTLITADRPGGTEQSVIDVDRGVLGLTLATDLMSVDHPTVERPAPDWPWSPERWGLLAMAVIVAGFVATGWWVRRWFLR